MRSAPKIPVPRPLTAREIEVLVLIAEGLSQKEVGKKLCISPKTVEQHKANIYAKIKVKNAVGVARFAIREGYMEA
jgi:DNA-binding NarL/FixJ family response regulator